MSNKILYNVIIKILKPLAEEWLHWMKEVHIPDVMASTKFESFKLSEIIEEDEQGRTFAIQYMCRNMDEFMEYQSEFAKKLQKEHAERYKDKYVAFRTLMNILSEG